MEDNSTSDFDAEAFNEQVAYELEQRGRSAVAKMSRDFDAGMSAMSSATVADHEGLSLTVENAETVADLRVQWFENQEENPDFWRD